MKAEAFLSRTNPNAAYRLGSFTLGGTFSGDYKIFLTSPPPIVLAERDTTAETVEGYNGDLTYDNGRYKNVVIPYKCAIIPQGEHTLRDAVVDATRLLASTADYRRFEDSFDSAHFRRARIKSCISVESIMEQAGKFEIPFDCKPQRYLKSGEYVRRFSVPGIIHNPTDFTALPIITVYGAGAGTVTVNGTLINILEIDAPIVLDCELQDAYSVANSGALENKNGVVSAPDFPVLSSGDNAVAFTGDITHIEIKPRWWTL